MTRASLTLAAVALAAGCATHRKQIERELGHAPGPAPPAYAVACPDVLRVALAGREEVRPVGPDGRLDLGPAGRPRVEGLTPAAARDRVAAVAGLPASAVAVEVAEYRSRVVYVTGAVEGGRRAVPYQGPEPVVEFLRRCGGLERGADLREVHVVRARVADGRRPEVYHVDLAAILVRRDDRTNLAVLAGDEVYVGATGRASLSKAVAPWLRPVYDAVLRVGAK